MSRDAAPVPRDDERYAARPEVAPATANQNNGVVDGSVVQAGRIDNLVLLGRMTRKSRVWLLGGAAFVALAVVAVIVVVPMIRGERFCGQPYSVKGAILDKYKAIGDQNSDLGCPTGEQNATPDGRGQRMRFTNDRDGNERWIYWSPETGAHTVWGDIGERWKLFGRERLGFPKTDEEDLRPPGKEKYQVFEHGSIYWRPAPPKSAYVVLDNDIGEKWEKLGRSVGLPVADEVPASDGGAHQEFESGTIYWHPSADGAYVVLGAQGGFGEKWKLLGYETGPLGAPRADEVPTSDGQGRSQEFEGGTMYWHPSRSMGSHPVWPDMIGERWRQSGQELGQYGYPVGDEVPNGTGCHQNFEGGDIASDQGCAGS